MLITRDLFSEKIGYIVPQALYQVIVECIGIFIEQIPHSLQMVEETDLLLINHVGCREEVVMISTM
jgi:hypothetical protein